jgi:uncharacterized protein (TIGR00661 family)
MMTQFAGDDLVGGENNSEPVHRYRRRHAKKIAYFISPHGFGHAARAASVMEALYSLDTSTRFEIFTTIPSWFFEEFLPGPASYHLQLTDIGLAQKNPFEDDFEETLRALNKLLPYDPAKIRAVSSEVFHLNCKLIICDIAPMGILVAKQAGIPSVLVENFTWDWIYKRHPQHDSQLNEHIGYLQRIFTAADFHVQTEPVCLQGSVDLLVGPASRKIKSSPGSVRQRLGLKAGNKLVLITTGGVPQEYDFLEKLREQSDIHFVIPGSRRSTQVRDNLILLPHHSEFFHPDLVNASDAVIGKAGYSTIAEVYHAGVPFGYIPCPNNPEAEKLVAFVAKKISGFEIQESEFQKGNWIRRLQDLLNMPRVKPNALNGADQIAGFISALLK